MGFVGFVVREEACRVEAWILFSFRKEEEEEEFGVGVLAISGCGSQAFLFVHRFMDLGFIVVVESSTNVL